MSDKFDYPALYETAGQLSDQSQRQYLTLIAAEYALLILAAVMTMNWSQRPGYFAVYALVLLASLAVLIGRSHQKPEQSWYRGRALAESIKTSSWRYCMRADPFVNADSVDIPRSEFREHLLGILHANRFIGDRLPPDSAAKEQIPQSMQDVRALSLEERMAYYLEQRIRDQREWYAKKAGANKRASSRWVKIGIGAYTLAIVLAVSRIVYPERVLWPIEPILGSGLIDHNQ